MLAIDVTSDSAAVAAARIREAVAVAIGEPQLREPPSEKQTRFAEGLGLGVKGMTRVHVSALIDEALYLRSEVALSRLELKPGDRVRKSTFVEIAGKREVLTTEAVVSSIQPNFRVFFKGGNGQGAWPTELEVISRAEPNDA